MRRDANSSRFYAAQTAIIHETAIVEPFVSIQANAEIGPGARIGSNSVIGEKIRIGEKAVVKPGSVVLRSVPDHAIVEGNPAEIKGYVHTVSSRLPASAEGLAYGKAYSSQVKSVALNRLKCVEDLRGNLIVAEFEKEIPFAVKRYFMIYGVPNSEVRGEHAHRKCKQYLICIS